jgi:polynucleotide 5'-hydroxyl-kinase GRC3/NOL9
MICGPKSSGKSTFAKLITNKLLSKGGVALLDLDPGQPEYSAPGQLTLIHIKEPNLGPPFSHPVPGTRDNVIRAHSIGAISPSLDPSLYIACALDLFLHYQDLLSTVPYCPLVINTPGWILGTGLEVLVELITKLSPTEVIYMSQDGPEEVVSSLQEAFTFGSVLTLPSQRSEHSSRTAAHLRTMQYMSYLHLSPANGDRLSWTNQPLASLPPWKIRYSGHNPGVLGIICYGEQPPANLLADVLNGSLVAVVVIDDIAAIPGWNPKTLQSAVGEELSSATGPRAAMSKDYELEVFDEESLHPNHLSRPLIILTPEGIPYFNPANAICLDPRNSHSLGLALIRGIDIKGQRLQVLTPISPKLLVDVEKAGKSVVLISGKLDTPGWAYMEDLTQKMATRKAATAQGDEDDDMESIGDEEDISRRHSYGSEEVVRDAPWIEKLEGSHGRGIGSRTWRVRRDLGKMGPGE